MTRTLGAASLLLVLSAALVAQEPPAAPASFSLDFLDRRVDACTDFYQFACGNWFPRNPLPADRSRLGRIQQLTDRNQQIIRDLLERAADAARPRTTAEQQIGDYYASCIDLAAADAKGSEPLRRLLLDVNTVMTRGELVQLAARFARRGIPSLVQIQVAPDLRESTMTIAHVWPGVLGLPDRDLYVADDDRSGRLRREYRSHIVTMFALLDSSSETAQQAGDAVLQAETAMARAMLPRVQLRDARRRDNPTTVTALDALGPNVALAAYLRELGAPPLSGVNVVDLQYVRSLDSALETLPLETWRMYLRWRVLTKLAHLLSSPFLDEDFRFAGTSLSGTRERPARWKMCADQVAGVRGDDQLGELVGRLFVDERFGANATRRMDAMIAALERSLERNIRDLEWMTPETKTQALDKLETMKRKVGAPEQWRDFSTLSISRTDLVTNALNVAVAAVQDELSAIGKPTDPNRWDMTPQTVNAYYEATRNEIVFPAGILQPPFFDATLDDAVNFGGIGAVIGHEMSHGFDDQGRKYDARGNLRDWWAREDDTKFRDRAACMVTQYSAYPAVGDVRLNGELTLGENVADNAGVRIAYYALMEALAGREDARQAVGGFTPEQRFFIAWAQLWCENATDQDYLRRAQTDSHANGRWRANGVLRNSAEFRKAFGCTPGTTMAPENACRVW